MREEPDVTIPPAGDVVIDCPEGQKGTVRCPKCGVLVEFVVREGHVVHCDEPILRIGRA